MRVDLLPPNSRIMLTAPEPGLAQLAADDLREAGHVVLGRLEGGPGTWKSAGVPMAASPTLPADADCIVLGDMPVFSAMAMAR